MSQITGEIVTKDEFAHERAMAQAIVSALGEFLIARTDDLPHRFRAPESFAAHMDDWGTNSTYHSVPIMGGNPANMMTIQMTTRPTQKIFEMVFTDATGMRLFTLEIEYGDAIHKKREVLLPWRTSIHKKADHRNPPRKGPSAKAQADLIYKYLSECPGLNWRKISPKHGAELTLKTPSPNQ
jgi:hypothetical protein